VISFGEDFPTVSRKHAAIQRTGAEVRIKNLSKTNQTLINGRPVEIEYNLNSGDEIQLRLEGTKLRFNTSASGTAKMGFTNKMNLVIQQAVKPYKTAAIIVLVLFVALSISGGFLITNLWDKTELQEQKLTQQDEEIQLLEDENESTRAALDEARLNFQENKSKLEAEIKKQQGEIRRQAEINEVRIQKLQDSLLRISSRNYSDIIAPLKKYVMAIFLDKIVLEFEGEFESIDIGECMCTGYILDNGLFVTARHCVDIPIIIDNKIVEELINSGRKSDLAKSLDYIGSLEENTLDFLQVFIQESGGRVVKYYSARNMDNSISLNFKNTDLFYTKTDDLRLSPYRYKGVNGSFRFPNYFEGEDWAYFETDAQRGIGLSYNKGLSMNLEAGSELIILGYSYGTATRESGDLEPYFTTAKVTKSGLENGVIQGTESGFDGGNSGGPVFVLENNKPTVIGIVTGRYGKIDYYTPLSNF
jgi:pSer/pThr/pTyr-binding forkhead associated (FHA) protein